MPKKASKRFFKLDLIGTGLIALLGCIAWYLTHPFVSSSIFPLCLMAYIGFRVIYELTWNRHNVPTVATGFVLRRKMAQILRDGAAQSAKTFQILDLGSGRGELSRYLARQVPNCHVTGIEMARWPHAQAQFMQRWLGPNNITFLCQNFDDYGCSQMDAVVLYLSARTTEDVTAKLQRELKPGSVVITHSFPLADTWKSAEILILRTPFREKLFVYRKT